jgi:hypothetical protein
MNPRRVHHLMSLHFPPYDQQRGEWRILMRGPTCPPELVEAFLRETFVNAPVVVEIHRKLGDMLPIEQAVSLITPHVGHVDIRIANRSFSIFGVIAQAGVVLSWRKDLGAC